MPSHIITLGLALALSSISYCAEIVATKQTIVMRTSHVTTSHVVLGAGPMHDISASFYKYSDGGNGNDGEHIVRHRQAVTDDVYINTRIPSSS